MKCFGLWVNLLLLPLPVRSWWCETSKLTGCRGQPRHFVRAASNPFFAFKDIETGPLEEPIVVDWDNDGDLDVILRGEHELSLFEFTSGNSFVKMEGGPFEGIFSSYCRPAVVDWNKDGRLDLIVGTEDGIKYYERQRNGRLEKADSPFEHIFTEKGHCTDLAVADWDADGNFDVLVSSGSAASVPMRHFEESNGKLMLVDNSTSPFQSVIEKTHAMRPLMEDWDGDGRMDLILMAKVLKRSMGQWKSSCSIEVHLQLADGTASAETTFLCMNSKGSGLSLVDVDKDGDKDAVIGGSYSPLKVFERTSKGLELPRASASDSIPLDAIDLGATVDMTIVNINAPSKLSNYHHPVLADWDLDGDLDLALVSDGEEIKSRYFEHQADDTVIELSGPPNISCPILWNRTFSFVDFNGDGKKDIVGFDSEDEKVNICIQTPSGFKLLEAEENPFRGPTSSVFPYRQEGQSFRDFGDFGWMGYPTFLDWDGDGDLDMLKITIAEEVYVYEQFSNGTFFPHALGVPKARDYIAADFDGDGDVDIAIIKTGTYLYFERKSDGSLEELFDTDNPFNAVGKNAGGNMLNTAKFQLSTLGDWNGDREMDMILVDRFKVRLFINSPSESFVEVHRRDNPFTLVKNALTKKTAVSLVDVNSDGKLDVVLPPVDILQALDNGYAETYKYFQQTNGVLVEQRGSANPFGKIDLEISVSALANVYMQPVHRVKNVVVDFDGDGDLDIVHANLACSRNDNGTFKMLEVGDPASPFYGIDDNFRSYWTFADLDGDGNLDLVQAYQSIPTTQSNQYMNEVIQEMIRNGTSKEISEAWVNSMLGVNMRFYRQVRNGGNSSFLEVQGTESPFHDIGHLDTRPLRPQMVDFDGDGDLDLVLGTSYDGTLRYFEQDGSKFWPAAANPFAGLSLYQALGEEGFPLQPHIVDWDGDGSLDLVVTGTDNVQFFQRGVCMPSSPYCRSGTCDQKSRQCKCFPGSKGEDCSLCGDFHVRKQGGGCAPCPGYGSCPGTCNRRGVCHDDADARASRIASNHSGFKVTEATGTGKCTCSAPFHGSGCQDGVCPPGKSLDLIEPADLVSKKYPVWEACVPCQSGRFKNFSGSEECALCPAGRISEAGIRCVPCEAGTVPSAKHSGECDPCDFGYVAAAGTATCSPCPAGTAPNKDKTICAKCPPGAVARSRDGECTQCQAGWVPEDSSKSGCRRCTGQNYASEGDEACRPCTFPYMILNEDNQCTVLYTVLFALAFLLLIFLWAVFGRLHLHCLKRQLNRLVAAKNWQELHATQSTFLKYGLWKQRAGTVVEDKKLQVKKASFQLGISLQYVFQHLEDVYKAKADQAEWRLDEWGPVTKSGFFVKVRNCKLQVDPLAAWNALSPCEYPKDPNFHQVAGVLAYGPLALGKNRRCPRDGLMDCSIVDTLHAESNSEKATWFLSWVWAYHFTTVFKALSRWWERHKMVSSAGGDGDGQGVYLWWCIFVNNQFRMLEAGQVEESGDLFNVFGEQLSGTGKMLMCLDQMCSSQYTTRIWCIFEVFVACQRTIPTTVILPELEVDAIENLKDLTEQCRVDAEKAKASIEADADAIKKHIQEKHQSFGYVNETVERALWCEVIAFLQQKDQSTARTEEPGELSKEQSERTTQSIVVTETDSQLPSTRDLCDMSSNTTSKHFNHWCNPE